jgi:hypothetical protein
MGPTCGAHWNRHLRASRHVNVERRGIYDARFGTVFSHRLICLHGLLVRPCVQFRRDLLHEGFLHRKSMQATLSFVAATISSGAAVTESTTSTGRLGP